MSRAARKIDQAAEAYERFHGEPPKKLVELRLPDKTVVGHKLGKMTAIAYRARRGGKTDEYLHEFASGAGPDIIIGPNGQSTYLAGGRYVVTDRGFEDMPLARKSNPAMLVVNPHELGSEPKRKAKMAKAKRNSKGQFVKAGARSKKRKTNPSPAPRKRRKTYGAASSSSRRTYAKRRKSNPIGGGRRSYGGKGKLDLAGLLKSGAMQGAGAVTVSVLYGLALKTFPQIPPQMKTGWWPAISKVALGLAGGVVISKHVNKYMGQNFAEGAITVAAVDVIRALLPKDVALAGIVDEAVYYPGLPNYYDGMGAMLTADEIDGMGAMLTADEIDGMGELVYVDDGDDLAAITSANLVDDMGSWAYGNYGAVGVGSGAYV